MTGSNISEKSRRIARNTVLLYFRMGVMILIGLFTYRVIVRALGITDYGVYSAVGGVVIMFMLVMNTVTAAISRFITVGLGEGDMERLKTIFSTSILVMAGFCVLIILLTESLGLWYLHNIMVIPDGRMAAAEVVLHTSMLVLVINLLSIPFTAVINAHEKMDAYAFISILEAVLKLAVAALVWYSPADKLVAYSWLLVAVAVVSRGAYALYSGRKFEECRSGLRYDGALVREMGAFAGWNFLGSGAYMVNTQGVNQLLNIFFGVQANAARGVADKMEQIVRQFATNIALALNPQMTKSYVGGDKAYAFDLACKGSKYYFWVLWVLAIPFFTDAPSILQLLIGGELPLQAALFTRLTLLGFLIDFTPGTMNVLQQAHGNIKSYYLITSAVAVLVFPITWLAFKLGAPAWSGYVAFCFVYLIKAVVMLLVLNKNTGFPITEYWRKAILPIFWAIVPALLLVAPVWFWVPELPWRFVLTAILGVSGSALGIWLRGLTPGEKGFILSKLGR